MKQLRAAHFRCRLSTGPEAGRLISEESVAGLILSGSPASVSGDRTPDVPQELLDGRVPVLGICYGLQLLAHVSGGAVSAQERGREFGRAELILGTEDPLLRGFLFDFVCVEVMTLPAALV